MKDSIKRTLKSRQIGMVMTMHLISGTAGTPADSGDDQYFVSSVVDNGTGSYTINFKEPARRDLHVIGLVSLTSRAVLKVSAIDESSVSVVALKDDGTAMDADFYITVAHAMLVDAKF
jgi:hypothetical protein